ncbi:DUF5592 family protein [Enterococcus sp. AZ072]|uniref:DUF5592 family protein n=1 Tax=unclassified Enterococcus TaxID=2608891 RepID=UPI003D2948E6
MGVYGNMLIPKTLNAAIKLAWFYLVDLLIVGGCIVVGYYIQELLVFPPKTFLMLQVTNILFGIFLCLPTKHKPKTRTIQIIIQAILKDRKRYLSSFYRM